MTKPTTKPTKQELQQALDMALRALAFNLETAIEDVVRARRTLRNYPHVPVFQGELSAYLVRRSRALGLLKWLRPETRVSLRRDVAACLRETRARQRERETLRMSAGGKR